MNRWSLKKLIVWSVVLGLSIGLLMSALNITIPLYVFLIGIFVVFTAVALFIYLNLRRWRYAGKLMNMGEFNDAITLYEELHEKYYKRNSYKEQALLGIANCYNRLGEFDKSLNYMDDMAADNLDKASQALYYAIYAHDLYFLRKELLKALEYIRLSRELIDLPETILTQAMIELELNGMAAAGEIIDEYFNHENSPRHFVGLYTLIIIDEFSRQVNENFMLGLYYHNIGDKEKAAKYLFEAAKYGHDNYFTVEARHMIKNLYS